MQKIVVTQDLGLNKDERERLNKLGEVKYYEDLPNSPEEWLERCKEADVICTGSFGLKTDKLYELENKFFSVPIVGASFLNLEKMKEKNILVSRAPGCNKEAVSEWIVAMILNLFRKLPYYINNLDLPVGITPKPDKGLMGKKITILGKGNIGSRVGKICEALEMDISYFKRNDNLLDSIKDADVVVDALTLNEETTGLLNKEFFNSFKNGSYFITVTSPKIYDLEVMLESLDNNILAGVATDCGSIQVGKADDPLYIRLAEHPKVLATPHIAYNTDVTDRQGNKIMIDNVEAYLKGTPINLV
jgi:phosphoglycerate dehydrogenase-like enzyme